MIELAVGVSLQSPRIAYFMLIRFIFVIYLPVDGQYCMTCGSDKVLRLWNPRSGVALKSYSGHSYEVLDCKASCDNANLCSCGMDKTVMYWDVASGNALRKYRGHAGFVSFLQINPTFKIKFVSRQLLS